RSRGWADQNSSSYRRFHLGDRGLADLPLLSKAELMENFSLVTARAVRLRDVDKPLSETQDGRLYRGRYVALWRRSRRESCPRCSWTFTTAGVDRAPIQRLPARSVDGVSIRTAGAGSGADCRRFAHSVTNCGNLRGSAAGGDAASGPGGLAGPSAGHIRRDRVCTDREQNAITRENT